MELASWKGCDFMSHRTRWRRKKQGLVSDAFDFFFAVDLAVGKVISSSWESASSCFFFSLCCGSSQVGFSINDLAMREKRSGCPRAIFRRYNAAMTQQAAELLQKALSLSDKERAELACSLIDSLDATVDEGVEEAWDEEIARRIHDIDSGKVKAVPWDEVKNRISSKLTHGK